MNTRERRKPWLRRPLALACAAALALMPALAAARPAFPGAVGFGAEAGGWRGGRLIAVTSLADRGAGTLRACAEATGPRVCIFRVAGTITLSRPIMLRSNVYVAGHTAPGGGIQLRLGRSDHGPLVVKDAEDVVIRFLKLRPGTGGMVSANIDALTVENARRVYAGNLSMAFASDETFNIHVSGATASDITLADSILAYSLDRANHPDGAHSKGALICSDEGRNPQCGRISLIRNLFAHHRDRNPDVKATAAGPVEIANNIFYDPISQFGEFYDLLGEARIAYVGNLALTGQSSTPRAGTAVEVIAKIGGNPISVWEEGNLAFRQKDCGPRHAIPILDGPALVHRAPLPPPMTVTPVAANTLERVLPARLGDVLPGGGHRDALDRRVLNDLARCEGRVIDQPDQAGGWPPIAPAPPPPDQDGDLLPDDFERSHPGLRPDRADNPWADPDGDGVPAVEAWLAGLAGDR